MKIKIESHERYGKCRVGEGWIVAADVARILGYVKGTTFANKHVAKEDKRYEMVRALKSTNVAKTLLINKAGVESMIDASANVDAEEVKGWVLSIMEQEPPVQEPVSQNLPQVLIPQLFNHPQFGNLRAVNIGGEPFFIGKDVAQALGYSNTRQALIDHVPDKFKKEGVAIRDSVGGTNSPVLINEAGLYKLIMRSKLPKAEEFSDWACGEVLPSIRKHGFYCEKPIEPPAIAAVDFTALVERMDNLELLVQTLIDGLAQSNALAEKQLTKTERGRELLQIADRLSDSPDRQKLLLHAANLINGKKIF